MAAKLTFTRAVRAAVKLKVLIDGPSGSGKTFGALSIAEGLAADGRIALIDSEHERASFYADRVAFDTLSITDHHPDRYVEAINAAIEAGYSVVVIDSLSHAWLDVLRRKEQYEAANRGANSWTLWAKFSPPWDALVQHILAVPVHVICTARSKQAYEQIDQNGKKQVVKLGMQPQVRDGTEYEFGLVFSVNEAHRAAATKDNTSLFIGRGELIDLADGSVPQALQGWLATAQPVAAPEAETVSAVNAAIASLPEKQQAKARAKWAQKRLLGCTEQEAQDILSKLLASTEPAPASAPAAAPTPAAPTPAAPTAPQSDTSEEPSAASSAAESPAAPAEPQPACPKCGAVGMRDDRKRKSNPRAPDFRCQAQRCDGVLWPGQWPPKVDPAQGNLLGEAPGDGEHDADRAGAAAGMGGSEWPNDDLPF